MESNHATIKQIPFPATLQPCTPTECFVTSTPGQEQATWASSSCHPTPARRTEAGRCTGTSTSSSEPSTAGLIDDVADGRAQAQALSRAGMPVYFPRLVMPSASSANPYCSGLQANCNDGDEPATVYTHAYPRQYEIDGPDGHRYRAYRITLTTNYQLDTFYGVQGTTWNDPPLLSSPSGTRTVNGRKLFLYKDGSKLTTVAWHHDGDAYWISNTLTADLTNSQMVSIAASLSPAKPDFIPSPERNVRSRVRIREGGQRFLSASDHTRRAGCSARIPGPRIHQLRVGQEVLHESWQIRDGGRRGSLRVGSRSRHRRGRDSAGRKDPRVRHEHIGDEGQDRDHRGDRRLRHDRLAGRQRQARPQRQLREGDAQAGRLHRRRHRANKKLNNAKPTINKSNCSFSFTGTGPTTLGDGTGAYAGITGNIAITVTFAAIAPKTASGVQLQDRTRRSAISRSRAPAA